MSMPWFKHYNNASSSLSIQKTMLDLGVIGYAYYFLLLELLCSKFDGENCIIDLSLTEVAVKLRIKSGRVQVILKSFSESNLLSYESLDFILRINAPILLDLKDKDFRRASRQRASAAPVASLRKRLKNKKEIKNKSIVENDFDYTHPLDLNTELYAPDLDLLYAEYPKKEGKKKAYEKLTRIIKTKEDFDKIRTAINNYKIQCIDRDKNYIKQFSSFVSVWEDYLEVDIDGHSADTLRILKEDEERPYTNLTEIYREIVANENN